MYSENNFTVGHNMLLYTLFFFLLQNIFFTLGRYKHTLKQVECSTTDHTEQNENVSYSY